MSLKLFSLFVITATLLMPRQPGHALETVNVTLPSKSFQFVIFPIAKERGYLEEEGINLQLIYMASSVGLQSVMAGETHFTGSGSSALVAVAKAKAPLKTVLAINDKVVQWLMVKPNVKSLKELNDKKIAVSGIAAIATFMLKQAAPKYGLDANKRVTFLAANSGNRLAALAAGAVDAALLSTEERYQALDLGMKEIMYLGNEVKNSWGTVATTDRFIQEKPKVMAGFMRAVLKALRVVKEDREGAIKSVMKFSGLKRELAERMYTDLIGTFTANGTVDEETQRNDLAIVRQIVKVDREVPIASAYDFTFAQKADQEIKQSGWRP